MERKSRPVSGRLSSVANSLRLLKVFTDEDHEIGINALDQRLGPAKSTVPRFASTLIGAADAISQRLGYRPLREQRLRSRAR